MRYQMLSDSVFVRFSGDPERFSEAMAHLQGDGPVLLQRVSREVGLTVLFKLVGFGGLKVGRQVPSRDENDDVREIQQVLGPRCRLLSR